jgi:hypothetical protein
LGTTIIAKLTRALGVVLGITFIVFPVWLYLATDGAEILWVQPILGVLFLVYGTGGYALLSKILPSHKNYVKR